MESFLNNLYRQIKHRVNSRIKSKSHLYYGLELMPKEVFMEYLNNPGFNSMYQNWISSGKQRKLVPTLDRIDSSRGYTKDNVQWATLSDNSKRVDWSYRSSNSLPGTRFYGKRWAARVRIGLEHKTIGIYNTEQEAHEAYLKEKQRGQHIR